VNNPEKKETSKQEKKSWWQKTWEGVKETTDKAIQWVDQHQTEIAIGIGVIAGAAAIILTEEWQLPLCSPLLAVLYWQQA
jgi:hypothetical protein